MTKNDLREMSKVVDQLIEKTDFTDPDLIGEMVTEANLILRVKFSQT